MKVSVAVVDPLPSFREGLEIRLAEAGFRVEHPGDVWQWAARDSDSHAVLFTVESRDDLTVLGQLHDLGHDGLVVVALLHSNEPNVFRDALASGANAATPRWSPPNEIVNVLSGAIRQLTILPTEVAKELAVGSFDSAAASCLLPQHIAWLRAIAGGQTIERVATSVGYSRRQMLREFRRLYGQMGVKGQRQALVRAARWGVLDDTPSGIDK